MGPAEEKKRLQFGQKDLDKTKSLHMKDEGIKLDYAEVSSNIDRELFNQDGPFNCHHCGVSCSHKGNLKRHILTKHTNLSVAEKKKLNGGKKMDKKRQRYGPDYEKVKN